MLILLRFHATACSCSRVTRHVCTITHHQTDSYAYGIVLLELLTSKLPMEAANMNYEDEHLHATIHEHTDARGGKWAAGAVDALAQASHACLEYRSHNRASVRDILPALEAVVAQHA